MAGRPKRVFTPEEVQGIERYARIGSYNRTISTGLNIPLHSLERHFGTKIRHWRAAGKLDMRENLHKQADTSPQTAIFIAKNELGMTDKVEKTDGKADKLEPLTTEQNKYFQAVAKEVMERMRIEKEEAERAKITLLKPPDSDSKAETA